VRGLPRDTGTRIVILVRSAKDADIVATFLSGMGYPTTSMHGDPLWVFETKRDWRRVCWAFR